MCFVCFTPVVSPFHFQSSSPRPSVAFSTSTRTPGSQFLLQLPCSRIFVHIPVSYHYHLRRLASTYTFRLFFYHRHHPPTSSPQLVDRYGMPPLLPPDISSIMSLYPFNLQAKRSMSNA